MEQLEFSHILSKNVKLYSHFEEVTVSYKLNLHLICDPEVSLLGPYQVK